MSGEDAGTRDYFQSVERARERARVRLECRVCGWWILESFDKHSSWTEFTRHQEEQHPEDLRGLA